jgi:hypothetical protein
MKTIEDYLDWENKILLENKQSFYKIINELLKFNYESHGMHTEELIEIADYCEKSMDLIDDLINKNKMMIEDPANIEIQFNNEE